MIAIDAAPDWMARVSGFSVVIWHVHYLQTINGVDHRYGKDGKPGSVVRAAHGDQRQSYLEDTSLWKGALKGVRQGASYATLLSIARTAFRVSILVKQACVNLHRLLRCMLAQEGDATDMSELNSACDCMPVCFA
jgi:hypothetical protein